MAMRLREVMYVAKLLEVNAFDQPNVELYKIKTKEILSL
jgi:glucose-6-phosphate isomerase